MVQARLNAIPDEIVALGGMEVEILQGLEVDLKEILVRLGVRPAIGGV